MNSLIINYTSQSFRDRDGFVVIEKSIVRRYVQHSYATNYDCLIESGLYAALVEQSLLIPHREIAVSEKTSFYKIIEPEFIPFISYPYEWTFDQWKEVAIKTLQINAISMQYGMILKDASPFNFAYYKGSSIFIDSLSFEMYHSGEPWVAYRQYCECILGPLSLISYCNAQWGRMFQTFINGWDLPLISKELPFRSWLNKSLLLHLHLHAKSQKRTSASGLSSSMNSEKLMMLWKLMEHGIEHLKDYSKVQNWENYYAETISSQSYLHEKTGQLNSWLAKIAGGTLIDLGANTGKFSFIASQYFEHIIAIESDIDCVRLIRNSIRNKAISNIDTVWSDITQPTPGIGWANAERSSLVSRLHADCLLALALVHHLCIAKNIRLEMVAKLFSEISIKWAIVEYIPKNDQKIIEMLYGRKDIFDDYSESHFLQAFEKYFTLKELYVFQNTNRKLYLWEKL